MASAETAIFLHIVKAAGTSLHYILDRQYPRAAVYSTSENNLHPSEAMAELERRSPAELRQLRLIRGHFPYGIHRPLPQPAVYFTFVRDPIKRVVSFYHFMRRGSGHYLDEVMGQPGMNLSRFVQAKASPFVDNGQVRFISGVWSSVPFGQLTEEHLTLAKNNLRDHFAVVGLVERFDEGLILLQKRFGWGNITYMPHNVSPRPAAPLTAEEESLLADCNRLDQALYDYAVELNRQQIEAYGTGFAAAVTSLQRLNRLAAPFHRLLWRARQVLS